MQGGGKSLNLCLNVAEKLYRETHPLGQKSPGSRRRPELEVLFLLGVGIR
jgi:hypothetical protein